MMSTSLIVLVSKDDAEKVLAAMKDLLNVYEVVSLADYQNLCGIHSTFADSKLGWTTLDDVEPKQIDGGFILNFPEPKVL